MRPVINIVATGARITQLRRAAGKSVRWLTDEMDLASRETIYRWERGDSIPCLDNLVLLASCLDCGIEDILVVDWC